jgi:hypothetical protein
VDCPYPLMLLEEIQNSEKYGYDRESFSMEFYGHRLHIIHNDACEHPETIGGIYHVGLYCSRCSKDVVWRGRFSTEDYVSRIALAKWFVLAEFGEQCRKS